MKKETLFIIGAVGVFLFWKPISFFMANSQLAPYLPAITANAIKNGLPPQLVTAVCLTESSGDPNAIGDYDANGNPAGGGLMGVTLATARNYGYDGDMNGLLDPNVNIAYGCMILADHYKTYATQGVDYVYAGYNDGRAIKNGEGNFINSKGLTTVQIHVDHFLDNYNMIGPNA